MRDQRTKGKKPAKPRAVPVAPPAPQRVIGMPVVRRVIPKGMIWCGKCGGLADEAGSESTQAGFKFCEKHRAKP